MIKIFIAKKSIGFRCALFAFTFSIFCFAFITYTLVSFIIVKQTVENSFKEKILVSQGLFADFIKNDIVTGLYSEVYRKCKLFFNSGKLDSIQVADYMGYNICSLKNERISSSELGLVKTSTYFDEKQKNIASTITANYSDSTMRLVLVKNLFVIAINVILIAIVLAFFVNFLSRYFGLPVQKISQLLQSSSVDEIANSIQSFNTNFREIKNLHKAVTQMASKIIETQNKLVHKAKTEAIANIASQVAHDIRSPLAALNVYVKNISTLPENERIFIRNATYRIDDIANNLISRVKNEISLSDKSMSNEIISTMVSKIVSEKRIINLGKSIKFELFIQDDAYIKFAMVNSSEFQAVISNLINNAVESIVGIGTILISVESKISQNSIVIEIRDNGCGMTPDFLEKAKGGVSTKSRGLGIGLSSAISYVRSWDAKFDIQSKANEGTSIKIELPTSAPPKWFPKKIKLCQNSTLVMLDDDQSIHDILCHRLGSLLKPNDNIHIVSFKDPNKFIEFYQRRDRAKCISFLFDYELVGSSVTGIDIIKKFELFAASTLITSRFEDMDIRAKCKEWGIKILPKNLAYYIPIEVIG